MCEIKSLNDRKQKKSTKIIAAIAGVALLILGIYANSIYGIISGVLLLAAGALRKSTSVTEVGIVISYGTVVYKYKEIWKFEDIKELHKENFAVGDAIALHFMKDVMSKRIIFTKADGATVVEMAKAANPKIHIDEAFYSK